jgi:hypothetical protein
MEAVTKSAMDAFIDTTYTVHSKVKRSLHRHSFSDLFLLLDMIECMKNNEVDMASLLCKESGSFQVRLVFSLCGTF